MSDVPGSIKCFEEWHEHSEQRQWELYRWRVQELEQARQELAAAKKANSRLEDIAFALRVLLRAIDSADGMSWRKADAPNQQVPHEAWCEVIERAEAAQAAGGGK